MGLKLCKNGFTLSEVLIAISVLGIVAIMTVPGMVERATYKDLESKMIKAKALVANGYQLMLHKQETTNVQSLPFLTSCNQMDNSSCVSKEHKATFIVLKDTAGDLDLEKLNLRYAVTGMSRPSPFEWNNIKYIFQTPDGMTFGVQPDEDFSNFDVFVDVNSDKKPNTAMRDLFKFRMSQEGGKIFDLSKDLIPVLNCSVETPGDCESKEQCDALKPPYGYYSYWDGACRIIFAP